MRRIAQRDGEGFVRFVDGVAERLNDDRLRGRSWRERQRACRRRVVGAGDGRPVGGRVADRDRLRRGGGQRNRERQRRARRVLLRCGRVRDRQRRHRRVRRAIRRSRSRGDDGVRLCAAVGPRSELVARRTERLW